MQPVQFSGVEVSDLCCTKNEDESFLDRRKVFRRGLLCSVSGILATLTQFFLGSEYA
jgi:hypothetical protein